MSVITQLADLQRCAWRVALRAAVLPLSTLFRRGDRHLAWKLSEVCFGGQRPGVYPEVGLGALLGNDLTISLSALPNHSYNVTETELLAISALVKQMQAETAFEIGTADGRTTLNIAQNLANGGTVFTLNLPLDQDAGHAQRVPVGHHFTNRPLAAKVTQLWGDSKTFDFSPYFGNCQVVFVDGDHFEPGVGSDSRTAMRLADRQGGVVLWHDALRFDVQNLLPRLAKKEELPIFLIAGTNLAALFFHQGKPVNPLDWAAAHATTAAAKVRTTIEAL